MALTDSLIYFDNNSTTPVSDEVLTAMLPFFQENYGNAASRLHAFGWVAQAAVEKATQQVADLINCTPNELIFTSGATESVNLAIKGIYEAYQQKGRHIVTCATEHKAVLDSYRYLEKYRSAEVTVLGVNREGLIDLDDLKKALRPETILLSVMAANNETGVKQPIESISEICKEHAVYFFCDATQLIGKERCDVQELGVDALAMSAHKFYGPKGVGALYVRQTNPKLKLIEQINGGGHQQQLRSGTLNVAGIVGLGRAAETATTNYWDDSVHISKLKNYFEHQLLDIDQLRINGSTRHRLYTTSNITFPKTKNVSPLLHRFAFSSGSACSTANPEPSHVLTAMGIDKEEIKNSFRFSFGRYNTLDEVKMLVEAIMKI